MNYLYGDSSLSPLKSNFLEFLRDAIDFSVFALQSDDAIAQGRDRVRGLSAAAETELERLDMLAEVIARGLDRADKGAPDSPASRFAAKLSQLSASTHRDTVEEVRRRLADAVKQLDQQEAAARNACRTALATFLGHHDLPDSLTTARLALGPAGTYDATLAGRSSFRLEWHFKLTIPESSLWRAPVRIETVAPQLEIRAPQSAKGAKPRAQKLDRHVVTEFIDDGARAGFKIRLERGVEVGFDVEVDQRTNRIAMSRVGAADDGSGAFDLDPEDVPAIIGLLHKLRLGITTLTRTTLTSVTLDGADFATQPVFSELVRRLVAMMAPIVREIAVRSPAPNQLVLRRRSSDDRQEEIFVHVDTLRQKYLQLPRGVEYFAALGFDQYERMKSNGGRALRADSGAAGRSEIAPSRPPPPPPIPQMPQITSPPISTSSLREPPPSSESIPQSLPRFSSSASEFSQHEQVTRPSGRSHELARNEALVAALKNIAHLARSGRTDDAYRAYASLYASAPFAQYSAEDQRLAVRLMLLAKAPPTMKSDAVFAAHHAAIARLEALIAVSREPADYELLGVACIVLGDTDAAAMALETGLELAREQNSDAALCERIKRRLAALEQ